MNPGLYVTLIVAILLQDIKPVCVNKVVSIAEVIGMEVRGKLKNVILIL